MPKFLAAWLAYFRKPESVKQLLTMLFFPGVSYPWSAIIWHMLLGGLVSCALFAPFGFRGSFEDGWTFWHTLVGSVITLPAGALVFVWNYAPAWLGLHELNHLPVAHQMGTTPVAATSPAGAKS